MENKELGQRDGLAVEHAPDGFDPAVDFDEAWYLSRYPDVARGLANGIIKSALDHFLRYGMAEGRVGKPHVVNYVIHIGPHKTATTYLQSRLKSLRPALREQGVLYPENWGLPDGNSAHRMLFERLRDKKEDILSGEFEEIVGTKFKTVLISSEDLADLQPEAIALLKKLVGPHKATIVYYIRRWSSKIVSSWKESLLHGTAKNFPEYVNEHLANPAASSAINFAKTLSAYSDVFGREALKIVSYDHLVETKTNVISHFVSKFLGCEIADLSAGPRVHESSDFVEAEIIRMMNVLDRREGKKTKSALEFFRSRKQIDVAELRQKMERYVSTVTMNEGAPFWRKLHDDAYEVFGDSLVDPRPPNAFFKMLPSEQKYVTGDYLIEPEVAMEIEKLRLKLR